jgi:hypothetical protein
MTRNCFRGTELQTHHNVLVLQLFLAVLIVAGCADEEASNFHCELSPFLPYSSLPLPVPNEHNYPISSSDSARNVGHNSEPGLGASSSYVRS